MPRCDLRDFTNLWETYACCNAVESDADGFCCEQWGTRGERRSCAPNPATAVLEILVHSQVREPTALAHHRFIKVDIPDEVSRHSVDEAQLPADWSRRIAITRAFPRFSALRARLTSARDFNDGQVYGE